MARDMPDMESSAEFLLWIISNRGRMILHATTSVAHGKGVLIGFIAAALDHVQRGMATIPTLPTSRSDEGFPLQK